MTSNSLKSEGFKPIKHEPPNSFYRKLKFHGRMLLDFHILTIYSDIKQILPLLNGKILDIGCGQSPYKFLLNQQTTQYIGIDVIEAESFDYMNNEVISFDGENIPFDDGTFDGVICTEVLEHVYNYQKIVDEMNRVCKTGATCVITIPFSARYHYIPYDYFRYTPSALENIFAKFKSVTISPRGTDIVSISAKFIVLFARNIIPDTFLKILFMPLWIAALPLLGIAVIIGHISRVFNLGSNHDPLGYTIKLIK